MALNLSNISFVFVYDSTQKLSVTSVQSRNLRGFWLRQVHDEVLGWISLNIGDGTLNFNNGEQFMKLVRKFLQWIICKSDLSHVLTGVLLAAASFAIIKLIAMVLA